MEYGNFDDDDDDEGLGEDLRSMIGGCDTATPDGLNGHNVALPQKESCSCFTCEKEGRFIVDKGIYLRVSNES